MRMLVFAIFFSFSRNNIRASIISFELTSFKFKTYNIHDHRVKSAKKPSQDVQERTACETCMNSYRSGFIEKYSVFASLVRLQSPAVSHVEFRGNGRKKSCDLLEISLSTIIAKRWTRARAKARIFSRTTNLNQLKYQQLISSRS